MKRFLLLGPISMAILGTTISFAQSLLAEQFTTLSEQIIEQSERPFDKLEELKVLFTSCAENYTNLEIKTACKTWLNESYPRMKESTPQQIYVELGTGDVEIKKVGEKTFNPPA